MLTAVLSGTRTPDTGGHRHKPIVPGEPEKTDISRCVRLASCGVTSGDSQPDGDSPGPLCLVCLRPAADSHGSAVQGQLWSPTMPPSVHGHRLRPPSVLGDPGNSVNFRSRLLTGCGVSL
jgi:hypothetical protein